MQSGVGVRGGVEEKGRGEYEITHQPVTEGRNQLHIRAKGINIQESPFNVTVVSPVDWFRAPIQGLNNPWGVVFNHVGEMFIHCRLCLFLILMG